MAKMRYARAVIQHVMAACLVLPVAIESARAEAMLFDNLGTLHHEITSTSDLAKKFFDQGLRLVYAFNHEEAIAAFTEASRLDPVVAMKL